MTMQSLLPCMKHSLHRTILGWFNASSNCVGAACDEGWGMLAWCRPGRHHASLHTAIAIITCAMPAHGKCNHSLGTTPVPVPKQAHVGTSATVAVYAHLRLLLCSVSFSFPHARNVHLLKDVLPAILFAFYQYGAPKGAFSQRLASHVVFHDAVTIGVDGCSGSLATSRGALNGHCILQMDNSFHAPALHHCVVNACNVILRFDQPPS
jgi:hypothetical protein